MIYTGPEIILPDTLLLLKKMQADPVLKNFFLVGGTGLALQIGHRISIDLDLFSKEPFETETMENHLANQFGFFSDYIAPNTLKGFVNGIKVDFITHAYEWVGPPVQEGGISLASLEDIAAMKLNAIAHSGQRQKDFYDIYFLLEHLPLKSMLDVYQIKHPKSNVLIPLKGLIWFDDIDFEIEKPMLTSGLSSLK